jgi:hypothetical protein
MPLQGGNYFEPFTQGVALGYVVFRLSARGKA